MSSSSSTSALNINDNAQSFHLYDVPAKWSVHLYFTIAINALSLSFAVAAILIRLRDPQQRFMLKRTERAEGVYIVPHSPVMASIFIAVFNLLLIVVAILAWFVWYRNQHLQAAQTITSMLSIPLWSWAWISLFSPIYACHLFPPNITEDAVSKRLAYWVRWKPRTVNFFCYAGPIFVGVPIIALSAFRAARATVARVKSSEEELRHAGIIYQVLYAIWACAFCFTAILFVVYSYVLIRILKKQLSTLNRLDRAAKEVRANEVQFAVQQQPSVTNTRQQDFEIATNAGLHQISTVWVPSGIEEGREGNQNNPRRLNSIRQAPWLKKANAFKKGFSGDKDASLGKETGKYSKLELLRLNTRIIMCEAIVFTVFCLAWTAFSLCRACPGSTVLSKTRYLAILFVIQGWVASIFAVACAFFNFWRGLNVALTRMDTPPPLKSEGGDNGKAFKTFAQKFHNATLRPHAENVLPSNGNHIHVDIQLHQYESQIDDGSTDGSKTSPRSLQFAPASEPIAEHSEPESPWNAPVEWGDEAFEAARQSSNGEQENWVAPTIRKQPSFIHGTFAKFSPSR